MSRARKGLCLSPAPPRPAVSQPWVFRGCLVPIPLLAGGGGEQRAAEWALVYTARAGMGGSGLHGHGRPWASSGWALGRWGSWVVPRAVGLWRQCRHTIFRGEGCSQLLPGQRLLLQPTMWLGERSPACLPPPPWGRGRQLPAPGAGGAGGLAPPDRPHPGLTMPVGPSVPPASAFPMPRGSTQAPLHGRSLLPAAGAARAPPQPSSRHRRAATAAL